jgi:type III secretion protein L
MSQPPAPPFFKRVIKARDLNHLITADGIMTSAATRARTIIEDARHAENAIKTNAATVAAKELSKAQLELSQRVQYEISRRAIAAQAESIKRLEQSDEKLALLVTKTLQSVLAAPEFDQRFIEGVVSRVSSLAKEERRVTMIVSSSQLPSARAAISRIISDSGSRLLIEVVGRDDLPPSSCYVDFEHGRIDASLGTQLRAIRDALTTAFKHGHE